jgi:FlaA1/EpsC-like NDP-sugar epimerase
MFLAALPILLGVRYLFFVLFGVYRRVWRFAGARDWLALGAAVALSAPVALGLLMLTRSVGDFPLEVFLVDALLCLVLVGASRMALRALPLLQDRVGERHRVLLVGAGRSGRALARELNETPGEHVVGFLDDNGRIRRRRIQGITVVGGLSETAHALAALEPDEVLVTIPDADEAGLDAVVAACEAAGITCRFVRRETTVERPALVEATGD